MAKDRNKKPGDIVKPDLGPGSENTTHDPEAINQSRESQQEKPQINDQVASKEATADTLDGSSSAVNNKESNLLSADSKPESDQVGKGYTDKGKKKKRLSRRKKATIGLASIGVTGSMLTIFVTSPALLINHIQDMLLGKLNGLQTSQQRSFRRTRLARVSDLFSRDGRLGSRVIAEMESPRYGYKFVFGDATDPNKITGIIRPDGTGQIGAGIGEEIDEFLESRSLFHRSKWKTRRMKAFYNRYGVFRVPVTEPGRISGDVDGADTDPEIKANSRLHAQINEAQIDLVPDLEDVEVPEGLSEEEAAQYQERIDDQIADGKNSGAFDDLIDDRAQGIPDTRNTNPLVSVDQEISQGIGENAIKAAEVGANSGSVQGKIFGSAKKFFGATDLFDRLCIVKNRLRTAVTAARTVRALAELRYATAILGAGDSIRRGNVDGEVLGVLLNRLTSPDINGQFIGASSGFSLAQTGRFSKKTNDATRPAYAVDGKLTGVYKSIQDNTKIGGCGVWQNPFFQIGAAIAEGFVTFFSAGTSKGAIQFTKEGVELAVRDSIRRAAVRSVTKGVLRAGASIAIRELSFEGIMYLTQMYAEKSLTGNFSAQEQGAEAGNIIFGGGGVLHKQRNLAAGQVPTTTQDYAPVVLAYEQEMKDSLKNQSFFARILDVNNIDSLAWSLVNKAAFSTGSTRTIFNGVFTNFINTPSSIISSISGRAGAQDNDMVAYDSYFVEGDKGNSGKTLAIDHAGNLQTTMPPEIAEIDSEENVTALINEGYIDPDTLEPQGIFADHIENCVDNVDTISVIEGGDSTKPEEDCLAELDTTKKFKAHLAYLDYIDGVEAEFLPEELGYNDDINETLSWVY